MRILHLCDSLNPAGLGGYESYLHYLSYGLVNNDHQSVIVTQAPESDAPRIIRGENYNIHHLTGNLLEARKWEFFSHPEKDRESVVDLLFKDDDLEENVEQLVIQLSKLLRELQPDVVHAHSIYVVFNRVLKQLKDTSLFRNLPVVTTVHGLPKPLTLPNGFKTTDFDQLVSHCPYDMILGVSNTVVEEIKSYLKPTNRESIVRCMYNGVDLETFHPLPEIEKNWDLAFMGRLEHMKSVDVFPEMLLLLKETHPNIKMVITGEGAYKERILRDFEEKGVQNMVEYLGVINISRVPEIINRSRIFLYPSRREPFGLSVIEAMACGVPVVTANVYGPSEIITNGKDGIAVTPGDAKILAEAIVPLLDSPSLRDEIGKNGRKTVENRFSLNSHLQKMIEIYNELVEHKKKKERA
ncbi:MAG: glycosyltransferase family 4 protein [Candidatus Thorarchaeota archaeon]